jgi:hypothetical protein
MRRIALLTLTAFLVGLVPSLVSVRAHAQATRTWVSGVGDDANPCRRTAPCKTFAGAISKTAAAGEINCLDPGGFGAVTITKSMTLSCEAGTAGVLVAGTNGITFAGGTSDYLYLKGLDIEGLGSGLQGIAFLSGAALHVDNCVIRHFTGFGIQIKSSTANATFIVTHTSVFKNGNGTTGGGIGLQPTVTVEGSIDGLIADKNTFGIFADGTTGGNFNVAVRDSALNGNTLAGFSISSGASVTSAMLTRILAMTNGTVILETGATALVRVGESEITGNGTGVSGTVLSFGTNQLSGNGTDGTLTLITPAPALR